MGATRSGYRRLVTLAVSTAIAFAAAVVMAQPASATPTRVWDRIAECESGQNWNTNTGNGYSGGLQFHPETWRAYGGRGPAHKASKDHQIEVAERVLAKQGWGAWPVCSRRAGMR